MASRLPAIVDRARIFLSLLRPGISTFRLLVFLTGLTGGAVQAATYTFSASSFPACAAGWSLSGSIWTCAYGDVSLGSGDKILTASSVTIKVNANFSLSGNNTVGSASVPVNLATDYGALTLGNSGGGSVVYGNLSTSSGAISLTGTTVNGTVTTNNTLTTSGGSVSGNVSANNGVNATNTAFGGNVVASNGAISFSGGSVAGNVTSSNNLTATNGTTFAGSVTATNGQVTLTGGSVAGGVHSGCCVVSTTNTNVSNGISSGATNGSGGSTVIINGGTVSGTISTSGGSGISISNATIPSGSITATNVPISISNSTIGTGSTPVNVSSNNTVNITSGTVYGNVTAASYQDPATVVDTNSTVHGTCTSQTESTSNPGSYSNRCDGGETAAPHHLEIDHPSGNGLTCTPDAVTIKACADAACSTLYTGGVSGTVSAGGTPTVNWSGGTSFSIPGGSGSVSKAVQVTTPGSVSFGAASSPAANAATTCNFGSPACTYTAADAGFLVSAPNHAAESVATLTVQAVKKADNSLSCVPAFTGARAVRLACVYLNPVTGTLPVRVGGTALNASANATGACDASGAAVTLNFNASGIATPSLMYADAGQIKVTAAYTGTAGSLDAGLSMSGNGWFIVAPASFSFSGATAGPIKAGAPFSVSVSALNTAGAVTPNFGKESAPGPEGVVLSSVLVTPNPVSFPAAANPALGNGVIPGSEFGAGGMATDANGTATVTNLTWGEAGSITLSAGLINAYGYLGTSGTPTLGQSLSLLSPVGASGTIGRFIPDHFDTVVTFDSSTGVPMACPAGLACPLLYNGFAYAGQPFGVSVYAKNASDGTTANYDGSFGLSRATVLSAWDARGGSAQNPPSGAGTLSGGSVPAAAFVRGVTTTPVTPAYAFSTVPAAPSDIYLRAVEAAGGDGVTSLRGAQSVEGGLKVVSGRLRLLSAYGSDRLPLPVSAAVQYWNGSSYVVSSTDSVSRFSASDLAFSNCQGTTPSAAALPYCPPAVSPSPSVVNFTNGVGTFTLSAPGAGNGGSVDFTLSVPAWLPAVPARATFGLYKNSNDFIYLRERY